MNIIITVLRTPGARSSAPKPMTQNTKICVIFRYELDVPPEKVHAIGGIVQQVFQTGTIRYYK